VTPKQVGILSHIAAWAASYPCIHVVHVFGSIARNQATPISDIDIAFEYVANIDKDSALVASYTKANEDWDKLVEDLKSKFGHQPSITGLSPFNAPYDYTAWRAIRAGRQIGKIGKAIMTWTEPY
jgi:predicted nucleotidyltransferase